MPEQKSSKESKRKVLDPSQLKGRRFGRVLTKLKIITREQVHEALSIQKVAKKKGDFKKVEVRRNIDFIKGFCIFPTTTGKYYFPIGFIKVFEHLKTTPIWRF